jgi:hypothetical protein
MDELIMSKRYLHFPTKYPFLIPAGPSDSSYWVYNYKDSSGDRMAVARGKKWVGIALGQTRIDVNEYYVCERKMVLKA